MKLSHRWQVVESPEVLISSDDMDAILNALKMFEQQKNFSELRTKAMRWASSHNAQIRANELTDLLARYTQECSKVQALTTVEFDAEKVQELLSKTGQPLGETLKAGMRAAMPALLNSTLTTDGLGKMLNVLLMSCWVVCFV